MSVNLNPQKALIFRIVHVENIPWILECGALRCRNRLEPDAHYVNIGNPELIDKRSRRMVPVPPGGTLSDYVPFYFTPFSMMMYNITTGYGGIKKREKREIVILVSSMYRLQELGIPTLFTNQHAYAADTEFYSDLTDLRHVDWPLLQSRNFKTEDSDPGRQLRYQAEALVHSSVPLHALLGIGCHDDKVKIQLESLLANQNHKTSVKTTPSWYF